MNSPLHLEIIKNVAIGKKMNTSPFKIRGVFKVLRLWKPMSENNKQKFSTTGNAAVMLNSSEALLKVISEKHHSLTKQILTR